jgi:hypothetical protein
MCEPVSITMGAVTAATAIAKGVGDYQAGQDNAAASRRNAVLADNAASDALQRGEATVARQQMQVEQVEGQQATGYAGQGVELDNGSAARTATDTAAISAIDNDTARNNARREAYGLKTQGVNFRAEAATANRSANYALATSIISGTVSGASASGYFNPKPVAPGKV